MHEISSPTRAVPQIRLSKKFVWKHRWLPKTAAAASWLLFLTSFFWRKSELLTLLAVAIALSCTYAWGYSDRAFRLFFSPALIHLKRKEYAAVWDSLAATRELATVAACGEREEAGVRSSVQNCVRNIRELVRISPQDEILEIGCGVGRVGRELAPHCKSWTGCDISDRMLTYASERLKGIENTRLVLLQRGGLREFKAGSFDVVFATNMLCHLDELDRWRYVEEAFRTLRPGGRLLLDNVDLESDAGWKMFTNDALSFGEAERPPYMPRYSTAAEFVAYASRAGFSGVTTYKRSPLVIVTAEKP